MCRWASAVSQQVGDLHRETPVITDADRHIGSLQALQCMTSKVIAVVVAACNDKSFYSCIDTCRRSSSPTHKTEAMPFSWALYNKKCCIKMDPGTYTGSVWCYMCSNVTRWRTCAMRRCTGATSPYKATAASAARLLPRHDSCPALRAPSQRAPWRHARRHPCCRSHAAASKTLHVFATKRRLTAGALAPCAGAGQQPPRPWPPQHPPHGCRHTLCRSLPRSQQRPVEVRSTAPRIGGPPVPQPPKAAWLRLQSPAAAPSWPDPPSCQCASAR